MNSSETMTLVLIILLIMLQIADLVTTLYGIKHKDAVEVWKPMVMLQSIFGLQGAIVAVKLGIIALFVYALVDKAYIGYEWILMVLCGVYIYLIYRNVKTLWL